MLTKEASVDCVLKKEDYQRYDTQMFIKVQFTDPSYLGMTSESH